MQAPGIDLSLRSALDRSGCAWWGGRGSNPRRPDYEFDDIRQNTLETKGFCGIIGMVGHVWASTTGC